VKTATLIFEDGSTSALAQVTTFGYDETHEMTTGVDQTEVKTYHFSEVSQQNNPATILIGNITLGNLARTTETTYSTNSTYRDTKHILPVPTIVKIKDPRGTSSRRAR
jgi:hypothetical protein